MVHVTVGTANAAQGIVNASRARVPLLFLAGRNPITEEGLPGSRKGFSHFGQEALGRGGLGPAGAPPRARVPRILPREVLSQPLGEITITSPARRMVPSRLYPDPAAIDEAARILASARFPLILTTSAGRA